jgi:thiol-disulfide isomerase/thioredoxin
MKCEKLIEILNGKEEYRSPYAKLLEELGNFDTAWRVWFELAQDDEKYVPELQRLHKEMYPEENFDEFWNNNRFSHFPLADNFKFVTINEDILELQDYSGKWVFIDFWYTGCLPCIIELPMIDSLNKIVESSTENEGKVISILMELSWEKAEKILASFMSERK